MKSIIRQGTFETNSSSTHSISFSTSIEAKGMAVAIMQQALEASAFEAGCINESPSGRRTFCLDILRGVQLEETAQVQLVLLKTPAAKLSYIFESLLRFIWKGNHIPKSLYVIEDGFPIPRIEDCWEWLKEEGKPYKEVFTNLVTAVAKSYDCSAWEPYELLFGETVPTDIQADAPKEPFEASPEAFKAWADTVMSKHAILFKEEMYDPLQINGVTFIVL